jgi:glycosyltransferase involved in cell wall biosynthesis
LSSKIKYSVCHLFYEEFPRDPRVRRYVNALNEAGIYCIVICSKKKKDRLFENWNGNRIYRIPIAKFRKSFLLTFFEYAVFTFFSSFLISYLGVRFRFKIIHVHTLPDSLIFASALNKLFGAKLVLDLHEIFPELFIARKPGLENSFWVKILKFNERISIKFADILLTIHNNARDIFVSRNKNIENKIHVILNGVDTSEFKDNKLTPTDKFVIIYNGTINKILNLTSVVEAVAELKKKLPPDDFDKIVYRLYGDGPSVDEILSFAEKLGVKDKVEYMGYIEPDVMRKDVLKSNVLVLPPLKNIYSDLFYTIKLIETVYLKIPVIATRLNTYMRYYREESIFYFDSGNIEQLAERITDVFYNKNLVSEKVENAFSDYQKVRWEIMKERYMNIINGLLSK